MIRHPEAQAMRDERSTLLGLLRHCWWAGCPRHGINWDNRAYHLHYHSVRLETGT